MMTPKTQQTPRCGRLNLWLVCAAHHQSCCRLPHLLQRHQNAPFVGQRCSGLTPGSAGRNH